MDKEILSKIDHDNLTELDMKIINFIKKKKEISKNGECPKPSKLIISTMSGNSGINKRIDLEKITEILKNNMIKNNSQYMLKGIKFKDLNIGETKTERKKRVIKSNLKKINRKKKTDKFSNQVTYVINPTGILKNRNITIKLFRNGNITLTGIKKKNDGLNCVKFIKNTVEELRDKVVIDDNEEEIKITKYEITMINSGFSLNFCINRNKLYEELVKKKIYVSYEPTRYAGVKISYLYNKEDKENKGICKCKDKCTIEFKSKKKNNCKVVTIAVFEEGNVIITGGNKIEHIEKGYEFLTKLCRELYRKIFALKIE